MRTIREYKEMLDLLRDEINVREINFLIGNTDKGLAELIYNGKEFYYTLDGVPLTNTPSDEVIAAVVESSLSNL